MGGQESQRPRRVPWKLCSSRQMTSTANLPHPSPEHASFSGRATSVVIRRGLVLLQLNVEEIQSQDPSYRASGDKESGNSHLKFILPVKNLEKEMHSVSREV